MQIYTKKGDAGQTSLYGGSGISKSALPIHACGELDELNAFIGAACSRLGDQQIVEELQQVQSTVFVMGAIIAGAKNNDSLQITVQHVEELEKSIDAMEAGLTPLRNFILPGGSEAVCSIHVARAVCRRAERAVVACDEIQKLPPVLLQYINRLSDYLFVLARFIGKMQHVEEVVWKTR